MTKSTENTLVYETLQHIDETLQTSEKELQQQKPADISALKQAKVIDAVVVDTPLELKRPVAETAIAPSVTEAIKMTTDTDSITVVDDTDEDIETDTEDESIQSVHEDEGIETDAEDKSIQSDHEDEDIQTDNEDESIQTDNKATDNKATDNEVVDDEAADEEVWAQGLEKSLSATVSEMLQEFQENPLSILQYISREEVQKIRDSIQKGGKGQVEVQLDTEAAKDLSAQLLVGIKEAILSLVCNDEFHQRLMGQLAAEDDKALNPNLLLEEEILKPKVMGIGSASILMNNGVHLTRHDLDELDQSIEMSTNEDTPAHQVGMLVIAIDKPELLDPEINTEITKLNTEVVEVLPEPELAELTDPEMAVDRTPTEQLLANILEEKQPPAPGPDAPKAMNVYIVTKIVHGMDPATIAQHNQQAEQQLGNLIAVNKQQGITTNVYHDNEQAYSVAPEISKPREMPAPQAAPSVADAAKPALASPAPAHICSSPTLNHSPSVGRGME